jgi:integrase
MTSIFLLLQKVHEKVHYLPLKMKYSEPRFYTGGVNINSWSTYSKEEQKVALTKDWYVYFSFRNPQTNKLVRQQNIKGGINIFKDKRRRHYMLKTLAKSLTIVLEEGFDPYKTNLSLKEYLTLREQGEITTNKETENHITDKADTHIDEITIKDAFQLGMSTKERVLNANSYSKFKSRIKRFEKWLLTQKIRPSQSIEVISKKVVIQYLNHVLQESSPRNRNNTRTDLSSFLQTLVDNDVIQDNFIKKINVLKAVPERNKTYTPKEQEDIFKYLKDNDAVLFLFVQFISYNFLRPIEVCRLKIGDIDIVDKKIYVRAKNKPVKTKIIPDILINELPDLTTFNKNDFLFTDSKLGGKWDTLETNKRDLFSKRFKKVKDHFGFGKEYGLYSFRHTFITKLYKEMIKTGTPHDVKSKLQLITGHSSMKALEQYLRDIDAALPNDYSKLLA